MQFLQLRDITYIYPQQSEPVFEKVSFTIGREDKIALIGRNGAGKTTLIKILLSQITDYQGEIVYPKNKPIIGYLPQDLNSDLKKTVYKELIATNALFYSIINQIEQLSAIIEISSAEGTKLATLWDEYYNHQLDEYEHLALSLLADFHLTEYCNESASLLSEGGKTRLQLCKLMLLNPQILVLDEPTNHLDIENLEWLESWVNSFSGAILYVSHDRCFIDNTATKIVELNRGSITSRKGNYSTYMENLQEERDHQIVQYKEREKLIHKLQNAAQKRRSWAKTFQKETRPEGGGSIYESISNAARTMNQQAINIERRIDMLNTRYRVEKPWQEKERKINFDNVVKPSTMLISFDHVSKSYNKIPVLNNISFYAQRGEKIWISGKNGSGKTTLMKILAGKETTDSGEIIYGERIRCGWFDQQLTSLPIDISPLEYLQNDNLNNDSTIRNYFGCLGMSGDIVNRLIGTLSFGERAKTLLVKLLISNYNLLLLDEPTNHLDIQTREMLEYALMNYNGTVIFVSHDRAFISNLATRKHEL